MYSEKEEKLIKELERESFRRLKEKENKNKNISHYEDILYTSDFILEKFKNSGDSGDLFLAINKYNNKKYILKHEYYDCACNEYMYSKIGNKMGIKIAPVKLFVVNDKYKKFKSDFVCGIEYLENCECVHFYDIVKNKDKIQNWEDYFKMFGLESLFDESDGIEIVKYNNEIYRLDTTSSFSISDFSIHPLAYDYNNNGINIQEFAGKYILQSANRNTQNRLDRWKIDMELFIKKFGEEYLNYYLEPFNLLNKISEKDIETWISNLTIIYPNIIGDYFKKYITNLKLDSKEFININKKI